ncbi:tyrosine recombinase XerC [Aristophania vespae]|uniref:tyrosine recombinase XerC n=1 Tax=Aristophania vespae TaxID=2697033 RepID=UPI002351825D|nr:tyrosine recombinase XerC [Aristophania vespae]UMM63881.1 Tyrosine recombinase XerC [Aristophania vespae]
MSSLSPYASRTAYEIHKSWADWLRFDKNLSPKTVIAYSHDCVQALNFFQRHLGREPLLTDLQNLNLTDFRAWLAFETSKSEALARRQFSNISRQDGFARSRARRLSALRSFFLYLKKEHGIDNDSLSLLRSPRLKPRLPRPLNIEEAQQAPDGIAEQAHSLPTAIRDQALFTLLYGAGLRISEALSLTIADLKRSGGETLLIHGKGGKERFVPLLPKVGQSLNDWLKVHPSPHPTAPLFCGVRGGPLNPGVAQRAMRQWRKLQGLPDSATPHAFRHAFASHLLQGGADLRAIQELLGHASLSSTQIYTLADERHLMDVWQKAHPRAKVKSKP